MSLKTTIKSSPALKSFAVWMLQAPHQYRPRWWIRLFVNPFVHRRSRKAIIRWRSRLDLFPYKHFEIGAYSIVEDFALIANACGDVVIGEKVLIGVGSTIIGPITMGNNILLAQNVVMSGMNHEYEDVEKPVVEQGFTAKEIVVEDGAWIGAGVVVVAGVKIGKNAVIGAGSVVTKDVPAYSVAVGNPARVVRQFNFEQGDWQKAPTEVPMY